MFSTVYNLYSYKSRYEKGLLRNFIDHLFHNNQNMYGAYLGSHQ